MRLNELIGFGGDARVTGFAIDHRKVAPGTVFGAFRGSRFDGEDYIPAAIEAGAVAVVARTGALLGVIPDESRDIDTSELLPLVGETGH